MALKDKFVVQLTPDQRQQIERVVSTGRHPAATVAHARILLKADIAGPDRWPDARIAEALDCGTATVARVRKQWAQGGLEVALSRRRPTGRQYRKLDGAAEARLVALTCSPPPEGHARWTLKLLAQRLIELEVVTAIDPATVYRTLKKTCSSRG